MATRQKTKQPLSERSTFTQLEYDDLIEAVQELGFVNKAAVAVGLDKKTVWRMEQADPTFAIRLREARQRGLGNLREHLEGLLVGMAEKGNAPAAMFLLKKLDPSYRENHNVNVSSTPTNYTIDLSLPTGDDTPHDADRSTATLLE
jgi:hypothetical protein